MMGSHYKCLGEATCCGYSSEVPQRQHGMGTHLKHLIDTFLMSTYNMFSLRNNKMPIKYGKKVSYLELCVCSLDNSASFFPISSYIIPASKYFSHLSLCICIELSYW